KATPRSPSSITRDEARPNRELRWRSRSADTNALAPQEGTEAMTLVELEYPKIERIEGDERYAKFACEPLPPGYGTTLGNSLRRVLLSSLPGAAITAARVRGDRKSTRLNSSHQIISYAVF